MIWIDMELVSGMNGIFQRNQPGYSDPIADYRCVGSPLVRDLGLNKRSGRMRTIYEDMNDYTI